METLRETIEVAAVAESGAPEPNWAEVRRELEKLIIQRKRSARRSKPQPH